MAGMSSILGIYEYTIYDFKIYLLPSAIPSEFKETLENPLADGSALFRMELGGIEIIAMQGGAEGDDVVRRGRGELADRDVETVDEVDKGTIFQSPVSILRSPDLIPPHVGHLVLVANGLELQDIHGKDVQAIGVALLGVAAHQLLSDADTQYRLLQRADDHIQSVLAQIAHCLAGFALSREEYAVCRAQGGDIVRHHGFHAQALQRMNHGIDISGIVFDDCNFHSCFLLQAKRVALPLYFGRKDNKKYARTRPFPSIISQKAAKHLRFPLFTPHFRTVSCLTLRKETTKNPRAQRGDTWGSEDI